MSKKRTPTEPKLPVVTYGPPISFDEIVAIFERCEAQGEEVHVSESLAATKPRRGKK